MKITKQEVRLSEYSKPYQDILQSIENAGRNCYKSESKGESEKFIQTLLKRGHESVIEHEQITFIIKTSRNMTHELVRHRIGSYSQESTRFCNYGDKEIEFIPTEQELTWGVENLLELSALTYKDQLEKGSTPEIARDYLPGCLATTIYTTYNFRSLRNFLRLRLDKSAHPQMRELASMMYDVVRDNYPVFVEGVYEN